MLTSATHGEVINTSSLGLEETINSFHGLQHGETISGQFEQGICA